MPFTFFSHQAIVLPAKMKLPRLVSGTALVIGSMAPDFTYFLRARPPWHSAHTIPGQFIYCLPETLIVVWLVRNVIAGPLSERLSDGGDFHLHDYGTLAIPRSWPYWLKVIPSALLGSFSHIAWDSFTHVDGWSARRLGFDHLVVCTVAGHPLLLYKLLQHGSSVIGAAITLFLLRYIGERRLLLRWAGLDVPAISGGAAADSASPPGQWIFWLIPFICAAAGLLATWALGGDPYTPGQLHFWSFFLFRGVLFLFAGLCLACLLSRAIRSAVGCRLNQVL